MQQSSLNAQEKNPSAEREFSKMCLSEFQEQGKESGEGKRFLIVNDKITWKILSSISDLSSLET